MSKRFRQESRLNTQQQYQEILKQGCRAKGSFTTLWCYRRNTEGAGRGVRLGIIVSSKVSRKAVIRNRWKRWIRETFRSEKNRIKAQTDIVIRVNWSGPMPRYRDVAEEITTQLQKTECYYSDTAS